MTEFGRQATHYSTSDMARSAYMALMLGGGAMQNHQPGPAPSPAGVRGECWTNAQKLWQRDPGRYTYAEGLVKRSPGQPWEMHGYVLDQLAGHVVETTPGYEDAVEYRGIVLDPGKIAEWFTTHAEDAGNSVVWTMLLDAIDEAMPGIIGLLPSGDR